MSRFLLVLFLLITHLSFAQDRIPLYISSRLTPEAQAWNDLICPELNKEFSLFRPQDIDLRQISKADIDVDAYKKDFEGMKQAKFLLVLPSPSYGRDCAWEIGWFCGQGKATIAYVEVPGDWTKDAMVKGGLTAIITNSQELYETLQTDSSLKNKLWLIPDRSCLARQIQTILQQEKK